VARASSQEKFQPSTGAAAASETSSSNDRLIPALSPTPGRVDQIPAGAWLDAMSAASGAMAPMMSSIVAVGTPAADNE
jgi:hypothetical protein